MGNSSSIKVGFETLPEDIISILTLYNYQTIIFNLQLILPILKKENLLPQAPMEPCGMLKITNLKKNLQ